VPQNCPLPVVPHDNQHKIEDLDLGDGRRETTRKYNENKRHKRVKGPTDGH
jgi:hypothetical protein